MIPGKKELKLIQIHMYICDLYDQEIMTIYLFAGHCQKYFQIKDIHGFASKYLSSRFPKLPSYRTFNLRLNRLSEAFRILSERLISSFMPDDCDRGTSLVDSLPVITCAGRNPDSLMFTPAEDNDLTAFKQLRGDHIYNARIFGDKIYSDCEYFSDNKKQKQNIEMLTPVKAVEGQSEQERQSHRAYNDLFSTAVSKVRQPIESFFNRLNKKTTIQRAQKVRSTKRLLLHTMGKITIAFIYLIF